MRDDLVIRKTRALPKVWYMTLGSVSPSMPALYHVTVPQDVAPNQPFLAEINNQTYRVRCPRNAMPNQTIAVVLQQQPIDPPSVIVGVPVHAATIATGDFVEVDEISPAGWLCLIGGCFLCPGFNLLGLCMRQRRLIPVARLV